MSNSCSSKASLFYNIIYIYAPTANLSHDNYRWTHAMSGVSQTELILTCFYKNPEFLLDLWKDIAKLDPKQRWNPEKVIFGEVMGERII